ncbi:cytochrome c [Asticcacaulis sp. EMRT-3]|uniref:c-type cytochrome n=1 Tax=Asticcacaulis sp. EMRT-3 TaxID=3040349 RepID=UPI0024AF1A75|nr:cytochrome c [Asticcacaulis sp. EMRT-3]MDI7775943.1 cytochrome c [Asticcacaulis sp. EMRT-3]
MTSILNTKCATRVVIGLALAGALSAAQAQAIPDGHRLFVQNCSACHQVTGKGIPGAFPALAGDKFVLNARDDVIIRTVLQGRAGMPAFAASLDDNTLAAILTYVRSAWGNKAPAVKPASVARIRKTVSTGGSSPIHN